MHIASAVVRTRPENLAAVRARINELAGVEVHVQTPDGRLVVTVEADDRQGAADKLFALHGLPQVLSAALVYEQSESEH
jgi:nitrate reductase NapD